MRHATSPLSRRRAVPAPTPTPILTLALALLLGAPAFAGGHTWRVKEVFSNADGTVQFIEVWEALGGDGEVGTANHDVTSNSAVFTIPSNVAPPTGLRSLLLATQGFADLGVVTPDYIIPDRFVSTGGDTVTYVPFHSVTFGAGQLPTDGVHSLNADLTTGVNSPQNYAGDTGSVDVSVGPPEVPGRGGAPVRVARLAPDGSQLDLSFDVATCEGAAGYQLVHGFGSDLPQAAGGAFALGGAVCAIAGSPFEWSAVPDPAADASGLLWFLIQATDGATVEGPLGRDASGTERVGPGPGGSSGACGILEKDTSNTCAP